MSVDISAYMMVGNTFDIMYKYIDKWAIANSGENWKVNYDVVEILEYLDLRWFSPWFDSDPSYWHIGLSIGELHLTKPGANDKWNREVYYAKKKLVDLFGYDIELILMAVPHVT